MRNTGDVSLAVTLIHVFSPLSNWIEMSNLRVNFYASKCLSVLHEKKVETLLHKTTHEGSFYAITNTNCSLFLSVALVRFNYCWFFFLKKRHCTCWMTSLTKVTLRTGGTVFKGSINCVITHPCAFFATSEDTFPPSDTNFASFDGRCV